MGKHTIFGLNRKLAKFGLKVRDVAADGNCLFRALSHQLFGEEGEHAAVRREICQHMSAHSDWYQLFVEDDEPWPRYLDRMEKDGAWGGNLEIVAASNLYLTHVVVHQVEGLALQIAFDREKDEVGNPRKTAAPAVGKRETKTIHLAYLEEMHYASIVSIAHGRHALPGLRRDSVPSRPSPPQDDRCRQNIKTLMESVPIVITEEEAAEAMARFADDLDAAVEYYIGIYLQQQQRPSSTADTEDTAPTTAEDVFGGDRSSAVPTASDGRTGREKDDSDAEEAQSNSVAEDASGAKERNSNNSIKKKKISKQERKRAKAEEKRRRAEKCLVQRGCPAGGAISDDTDTDADSAPHLQMEAIRI